MLFSALSVVSPAGSRIRSGLKTIEARRWQPDTLPLRDLLIVQNNVRLSDDTPADPLGSIVAMVDVVAVRPWVEADLEKSAAAHFEEGWLAWELENIRPAAYNRYVPAELSIYELDLNPKFLLHPTGSYQVLHLTPPDTAPSEESPADATDPH